MFSSVLYWRLRDWFTVTLLSAGVATALVLVLMPPPPVECGGTLTGTLEYSDAIADVGTTPMSSNGSDVMFINGANKFFTDTNTALYWGTITGTPPATKCGERDCAVKCLHPQNICMEWVLYDRDTPKIVCELDEPLKPRRCWVADDIMVVRGSL